MSAFDLSILDEFLLRQIVQKLSFRSCAKFYRSCRGAKEFVDGVKSDWVPPESPRYHILFRRNLRYWSSLVLMEAKTFDWRRLSITMPYEAYNLGAAFLDGEFYVFGGFNPHNRVYLKAAYKLKKSLEWEQLPDMNEGRHEIASSSVVYKGCIWVMGGRTEGGRARTVEAYDPTSNAWITKPPMNHERVDAAAAVANGKIFVCGGYDGRTFTAKVEYYDPLPSRWIDCTPLPSERPHLFALVHGSHLMVLGSTGARLMGIHDVWSMDVEEADSQWTSTPMALAMHVDFGMMFGGRLLVGGRPGWRADPVAMEMFGGKTWSSGPELAAGLGRCKPSIAISDEFAQKLDELDLVAQADASLHLLCDLDSRGIRETFSRGGGHRVGAVQSPLTIVSDGTNVIAKVTSNQHKLTAFYRITLDHKRREFACIPAGMTCFTGGLEQMFYPTVTSRTFIAVGVRAVGVVQLQPQSLSECALWALQRSQLEETGAGIVSGGYSFDCLKATLGSTVMNSFAV